MGQDVATHSLPIEEGSTASRLLEGARKIPQDGGVEGIAVLQSRELGENEHQQVRVIPVEAPDEVASLKEEEGPLQVGNSSLLESIVTSLNKRVSNMDQSKETTAVAVEMTPAEQDSVLKHEGGTHLEGSVSCAEEISSLGMGTTPPEETALLKPMAPLEGTMPSEESTSRERGGTSSKGSETMQSRKRLQPTESAYYDILSKRPWIPTRGTEQFPMQFKCVEYPPGQFPLFYYVPGCMRTGYDPDKEYSRMDPEGLPTSPCSVVELDDSLYFYSQSKFQVNKLCRGGQRVEIEFPENFCDRAMYSVAATTNPSALHVIGATVAHGSLCITTSVERKIPFTILTLNMLSSGEIGQYFESNIPLLPVPKFLKDVRYVKLVSLSVGSVLFVGIAASVPHDTRFGSHLMLMAIDLSTPSPLWVILARCSFNVDCTQYYNHQLLQYNKSLLLVCGREARKISLEAVMKAFEAHAEVDSNTWVPTLLPIEDGKLVVYQGHLLSVGGLTGTHVWEDNWQASGMVYFYEPESKDWFHVGQLNCPRFGPALFVKDCRLFVVGGQVVTVGNRYAPGSLYELFEGVPADEVSVGIPDFSTSCIKGYFDSLEVGADSRRTQA